MKLTLKQLFDLSAVTVHACAILIKGVLYLVSGKHIFYRGIKKSCTKMRNIAIRYDAVNDWDETEQYIMESIEDF